MEKLPSWNRFRAAAAIPLAVGLALGASACGEEESIGRDKSGMEGEGSGDAGPSGQDAQGGGSAASPRDSFEGRAFVLDHAVGYTPVEDVDVLMAFSPSWRYCPFRIYPGCNQHFAEYEVVGDRLVIPQVFYYPTGCEGFDPRTCVGDEQECYEAYSRHRFAQDEWFRDFLESEPTIGEYDGGVVLNDGTVSLVFRELFADPEEP